MCRYLVLNPILRLYLSALCLKDITKVNNIDAHFVLTLGAKVKRNTCRVSIVYTELEGEITDR